MAKLYDSSDYAWYPTGKSLTETEHTDSCDINKMVKNAARGLQIRGGSQPQYGYDDTTLDGVQLRIQKEALEASLSTLARETELSPDELKHVPDHVQKKFGFKTKKAIQKPGDQNANDQTNANSAVTPPAIPPESNPPPSPKS